MRIKDSKFYNAYIVIMILYGVYKSTGLLVKLKLTKLKKKLINVHIYVYLFILGVLNVSIFILIK